MDPNHGEDARLKALAQMSEFENSLHFFLITGRAATALALHSNNFVRESLFASMENPSEDLIDILLQALQATEGCAEQIKLMIRNAVPAMVHAEIKRGSEVLENMETLIDLDIITREELVRITTDAAAAVETRRSLEFEAAVDERAKELIRQKAGAGSAEVSTTETTTAGGEVESGDDPEGVHF